MSRFFLLLEQIPGDVLAAIDDPAVMKAAWNAQFERTCIGKYLGRWLDPDSWFCTMAHAAELSLPLALKNAASVLKTGEQKDKAGEALIKYFSVPCKPTKSNGGRTRNLPEHDPESWTKFKESSRPVLPGENCIRGAEGSREDAEAAAAEAPVSATEAWFSGALRGPAVTDQAGDRGDQSMDAGRAVPGRSRGEDTGTGVSHTAVRPGEAE